MELTALHFHPELLHFGKCFVLLKKNQIYSEIDSKYINF